MKAAHTRRSSISFEYRALAAAIGLIYIWFGALKFFPDVSPAEEIAKRTIACMSFGLVPGNVSIIALAIWEVSVGILLLSGFFRRAAIIICVVHMLCTFAPFACFPAETFQKAPYAFTLLGQYIAKNIVILAALFLLWKKEQARGHHTSIAVQSSTSLSVTAKAYEEAEVN